MDQNPQTNKAEGIAITRLVEILYDFYGDGVSHVDVIVKDSKTVMIKENKNLNNDPLNQLPLK
jgi:hypothetical protein